MTIYKEASHKIADLNNPQKRIWFLSNLPNASVAYNNHSFYVVSGSLELDKLKEAFELLIVNHPSLRSNFVLNENQIYQKIFQEACGVDQFEYFDKSSSPTEEIEDFLVLLSKREFDLFSGNLFSFVVINKNNSSYFVGLIAHHIITDGFSFQIFFSQLFQFYNELLLGKTPALIESDQTYLDYILYRKDLETCQEAELFWKNAFTNWDNTNITRLNYDFEKLSSKSYIGKRLQFLVTNEHISKIKSVAFKARTSILSVLLVVHGIFFHKVLRQQQVVIGTVLGGRGQQNQKLIGMYVNTVPCKINIEPTLSFMEVLNQFLIFFNSAYKYQNFPLDSIIKDLNISRSLNSNPLFENIVILQPKKEQFRIGDTLIENYQVDRQISLFDTSLEATETENQELIFEWEFDTSLFEVDTINAYNSYYIKILTSVLLNPNILIKDIKFV